MLGATGMAGGAIVSEALARHHVVTALARHPDTSITADRLIVRALDVADTDTLASIFAEVDAAVLTIRLAPGHEHQLTPLTRGVLDVAAETGTPILIVGGSAPLRSPNDPERLLIEDREYVPDEWTTIAQASLDQFHACNEHPYTGWTYLSPPAVLEPGVPTGQYRRGTTTLLVNDKGDSRTTAPDLATAVMDELEKPRGERHFTVVERQAQ